MRRDLAIRQFTGERGDHARLEHLARFHRRQDRRQALRQHGFAGAWRADHQKMMGARGRDLEGALCRFLALDVLQIGKVPAVLGHAGVGARQNLRAFHVIENLDDGLRRQYVDVIASPGRFRPAGLGADEAKAPGIGGNGRRERARDGAQGTIEAHLANHQIAVEEILRQDAQGCEHGQRDRQVIVAAFLRQVGGREVDGKSLARQRQAHGEECRPHALAAFHDRLVGKSDDVELHLARQELRLDIDGHSLDALKGDRRCMRRHQSPQ